MSAEPIFVGKARPHYVLLGNVFEAALERVRWLFEEFNGHVSVSTSGGKDSTVVLELAAMVAKERGELPLKAHFLDQESEYQSTIDYMRQLTDRPDIDLDWYQIPFRLFNATSHTEQWSHVWDVNLSDEDYIRPKEPDSIHDNPFFKGRGKNRHMVDRFKEVLHAMNKQDGGAILTGMRCEESPTRRVFMTSVPSYKWVTWASGSGDKNNQSYYLFHPIYDWSYRDVWKSIYDHDWTYNSYYDALHRYGVRTQGMRVSSFHHETSMQALTYLQQIEPETWERATRRLSGINTFSHVGDDIYYYYQRHLPFMFTSWQEYLEYLIENLVQAESDKAKFRVMWCTAERTLPYIPRREIIRVMLLEVMFNDVYGSNMQAWISAQKHPSKAREWAMWKRDNPDLWSDADEEGRCVRSE